MITGISSGVGESLTKFFLNQNYKVIGMARRIEMVKKKFSNHPNLFLYKTDLSKVNDLKVNLQKIKKQQILNYYMIMKLLIHGQIKNGLLIFCLRLNG